jgi:hypothetical protein
VSATAERAFRPMLDSVRRRASETTESVLFITRANGPRAHAVIASLPTQAWYQYESSGQRRPPAAPPSRDQSYFFFAFFFAVFLAAFFFAGI